MKNNIKINSNYRNKIPVVITTINKVTTGIDKFAKIPGLYCLIIGDKKTPAKDNFNYENIKFVSYSEQNEIGFKLANHLPVNHYCRKNLGYLLAIQAGAEIIAETDDDNIPYIHWQDSVEQMECDEIMVVDSAKFFNVYSHFSDELIWPRGFPLELLHQNNNAELKSLNQPNIMIWQGLADKNPDVDAIYRLIFPNNNFYFKQNVEPIALAEMVYCPFNSQNTLWKKEAFYFLYLPLFVSFRFTDILRGYIAQRGIWAQGGSLAFGQATVYQERNYHDLMKDFKDEIECYLEAVRIIDILNSCSLIGQGDVDILTMYSALADNGVVVEKELETLKIWIEDIQNLSLTNKYRL